MRVAPFSIPRTWPLKIALPPDHAQFLFEPFPFDPRRPAAMFRRIVRGGNEPFPFDPRRPAAMFRRIVRGGNGVMGEGRFFECLLR